MTPLNRELPKEGHKLRTFEVWYNARNTELLQHLDMGRCGGGPFYFNKRTRKYICGATTMDNLRRWAEDKSSDPFAPPPDLVKPTVQPETSEAQAVIKGWFEARQADMEKHTSKFRDSFDKRAEQWKKKYEDFRGAEKA